MDTAAYRELLQQNFPQIEIHELRPITHGWDSFVLETNGELIFRFPRRPDALEYLQKEIRLLPLLEPVLSTQIPHFQYIGRGNDAYPFMFVGYQKLKGIFLNDKGITRVQLMALAPALADFLNQLHRFPPEQAIQAGLPDQSPEEWREIYDERYRDLQLRVFPEISKHLQQKTQAIWQDFLENEALFHFQPRLIHCDLSCEHILYDPGQGTLTGVIDWGDATIGDPALDFVGLINGHGQPFAEQVLTHYYAPPDPAFWQRIHFYTRYRAFSKLLYGVYTERRDIFEQGREELVAMTE